MLQVLLSNKYSGPSASRLKETSLDAATAAATYTPQSMIDEQVPTLKSVQEGYHGDSSFTSHAHHIKTTLEATFLPSELEFSLAGIAVVGSNINHNEVDKGTAAAALIPANDIGLGNMPLPPNEIVLKILRLLKTEEQRFFLDLPLFDIDEFIAMCRDIYFATGPVSLWTWICVNVGLYSLFSGIN